jgi:hypothetical protein
MTDELNFRVGAREIYDEVKGLRADVQSALSQHESLKEEVDKLDADIGRLKMIVYGFVPVAGLLGTLVGKFWI